jgi:hypothetical protein
LLRELGVITSKSNQSTVDDIFSKLVVSKQDHSMANQGMHRIADTGSR